MVQTFAALLLGHLLGDFVFQTDDMARDKNTDAKTLLRHCLIYALCMIVGAFVAASGMQTLVIAGVLSLAHASVDVFFRFLRGKIHGTPGLFLADQTVHIAVIFVVASVIAARGVAIPCLASLFRWYVSLLRGSTAGLATSYVRLVVYLCALVFCTKPAAVFVRIVLDWLKEKDAIKAQTSKQQQTGRYIGMLERVLVFLLCVTGQVSAIGFVIAAKGIVRFQEFKPDTPGSGKTTTSNFAEVFLLGTLMSFILAIAVALLTRWLVTTLP